MKEGMSLEMSSYKEQIIGVELPITVELKVTSTDPGFKGNTATASTKPAKLETGVMVQIPLFVNEGDTIKVDTRNGNYLERAG
jgi:elongation factor P